MCIKALIPVRSGSQRVKNKNIRPFANSSLLEIKIKQMLRIKSLGLIEDVVVNSNCDEMLELAKSLGASVVKRDEKFARDDSSPNLLYEDIAKNIDCENILFANCTNPLLQDNTVIDAIKTYQGMNKNNFTCLVSVSRLKVFMYKDNKPFNYDENNKPRSQDLPDIYELNHAFHLIPRLEMENKKTIITNKAFFYQIDKYEGFDIDNIEDFNIAECIYISYYDKQFKNYKALEKENILELVGGGCRLNKYKIIYVSNLVGVAS